MKVEQTLRAYYGPQWYQELLKAMVHLQHHVYHAKGDIPPEVLQAMERILILIDHLENDPRGG